MHDIVLIDIPTKNIELPDLYKDQHYRLKNAFEYIYEKVTKHKLNENKYYYTPGLLCLGAYLKNNNYSVNYINMNKDSEKFDDSILNAYFVGFSTTTICFNDILRLAKHTKILNPSIKVILGGYHSHYSPTEILNDYDFIDYIVIGEGERTLAHILTNESLDGCKGVFYRKGKEVVFNGPQVLLRPEEIPTPEYSLLSGELSDYNINVSTMRGCVGTCYYCVNNTYWGQPRLIPIEKVMKELEYLNETLIGDKYIHVTDNVFTYNKERVIELCNKIAESNLSLKFSCDTNADLLDKDIVKALEKAHVTKLCLGFEDADNSILKMSNKRVTYEESIKAAQIIKDNSNNILIYVYWLVGLPGSTHDSILYNIKQIKRLISEKTVHVISPKLFIPYIGTPFFKNPDKFGLKFHSNDWDLYERFIYPPVYSVGEISNYELYSYLMLYSTVIVDEYMKTWGIESKYLNRNSEAIKKLYV